jgi:hypothetical protein
MGLSVFANGIIDVPPQNKSYIAMPFGGYIKEIKVLDGMMVQKGQVLLVVEHPEIIQLQQTYLELQGQMEFLSADLERQKQLYEKKRARPKAFSRPKVLTWSTKLNWQVFLFNSKWQTSTWLPCKKVQLNAPNAFVLRFRVSSRRLRPMWGLSPNPKTIFWKS